MDTNRLAMLALVVLVVAAGVVGVRVADPLAPDPAPPTVDLDDPPAEVAYAVMRGTATRNFEVRYHHQVTTESGDSLWNVSYWARYDDDADRTAYGAPGDDAVTTFENPYYRWRLSSDSADRTVNQHGTSAPEQLGVDGRFHGEKRVLDCDCVRVERANASVLVLRVEDPDLVPTLRFGPHDPGATETAWLDLYVDRDHGRLRATVYRAVHNDGVGVVEERATERYRRWGAVTVERPDWAGYSRGEFVLDLLNYERER